MGRCYAEASPLGHHAAVQIALQQRQHGQIFHAHLPLLKGGFRAQTGQQLQRATAICAAVRSRQPAGMLGEDGESQAARLHGFPQPHVIAQQAAAAVGEAPPDALPLEGEQPLPDVLRDVAQPFPHLLFIPCRVGVQTPQPLLQS